MEKFYTELEELLKKDIKNVLNRNTSDAKSRIDNLRIVKDDLYLLDSISDKVKEEEKVKVSYGKDKNGFIDYYSMFETLYENGFTSCLLETDKVVGAKNRATAKTYSLMKFAHEHNATFIVNRVSDIKLHYDKEYEFFGSNVIKYLINYNTADAYLNSDKLICVDETSMISPDMIDKLKERHMLYGFI